MDVPDGYTEVLIAGAGPAGYMAAVTLARYGISFRIIDTKPLCIQRGHASGLQPRTQEILQVLDIRQSLDISGGQLSERAFWSADVSGELSRNHTERVVTDATNFPFILASDQASIEAAFDNDLLGQNHSVERPMELLDCGYESAPDTILPLIAHVKNHISGDVDILHAKYILGCDGAESTTFRMTGTEAQEYGLENVWAIADILADTDFPDIRRQCMIRSSQGFCMLSPNKGEGFRVYLQLSEAEILMVAPAQQERSRYRSLRPWTNVPALRHILQNRISSILSPYTLLITDVSWISIYSLTRRLATHFSDPFQHIYLLGDACHKHSPLTSQSLNASILDAHNLTWKLALVSRGLANSEILATYEAERRHIAQQLVNFDTEAEQMFNNSNNKVSQEKDPTAGLPDYSEAQGYMSGCGFQCPSGLLVNSKVRTFIDSKAISPLTPGKRLLPLILTRHVDGNVINILDEMQFSNPPCFHLFIFAGDLFFPALPVIASLSNFLATSPSSPLKLFSSPNSFHTAFSPFSRTSSAPPDISSPFSSSHKNNHTLRLLHLHLIHTHPHQNILLSSLSLPPPFHLWAWRIYADHDSKAHLSVGVSPKAGALALVRPDGIISMITNLDDAVGITEFMMRFLVPIGKDEGESEAEADPGNEVRMFP
ncbi:hypothetical protein MMC24_002875 [Lignoscripta atroalba]|nr:hypothetical protein [Lignoscripta atroalba]